MFTCCTADPPTSPFLRTAEQAGSRPSATTTLQTVSLNSHRRAMTANDFWFQHHTGFLSRLRPTIGYRFTSPYATPQHVCKVCSHDEQQLFLKCRKDALTAKYLHSYRKSRRIATSPCSLSKTCLSGSELQDVQDLKISKKNETIVTHV